MNQSPSTPQSTLLLLFTVTMFLSAALMFVVQPLFGKLLLPALGGTPAVWNTCMVFYQTLLFLGYLYAHLLSAKLDKTQQFYWHSALIGLSLIALPVALPPTLTPPTDSNPSFWLFGTLFVSIGLPFFVISTSAPLLQKWFAYSDHPTAQDPYFLYAASNAGSLLALLSYPFLLEPNIGLSSQRLLWSGGYGVLAMLIAGCGFWIWRNAQQAQASTPHETEETVALAWQTQLHWLVLALVPSSLLLGLTNFISTDIASVPLLWLLPLTVYLLSFIIVFSAWSAAIHPWMLRLQAVFVIPFLILGFINPADLPYWVYLILHVIAFFFAAMVCHGELARLRPHTRHLTKFYLILSLAGMLGGMFNAFVAPFVFNGIYEYPLMIAIALLLRPCTQKMSLLPLLVPAVLIGGGWLFYTQVANVPDYFEVLAISLMAAAIASFFLRNKPLSYAGLTGAIIVLSLGLHGSMSKTLYQKRSFFGVFAVRESLLLDETNQPEKYRELFHGTTKHGAQRLTAAQQTTPLTYYSRPGPIGQLFSAFDKHNQNWTIGAVGLGAGALACYSKTGQHWTFYEIDPLVVSIAKNPAYFSYLSRCNPNAEMVIGDARLSLAKEPNHKFDVLIMDAFSSDAVPVHLITREALQLYVDKLKDNGLLAFHITNRHLALKKVLAEHAKQLKLSALLQEYSPDNPPPLVSATDWVVIAKSEPDLLPLQQSRLGHWQQLPLVFNMQPWTDDFTNIIGIWK